MSPIVELECKKFCVRRCLEALTLSIGMQYLLLTVFLLFVNFSILHPIQWITQTFLLIFSFYTWLWITPLIAAIIFYGIFLGNSYLSIKKYYPSRFSWLYGTILRKMLSLLFHGIIGFLTAWLYSRFLHENYRNIFKQCFDGYCLNNSYIFLVFNGIYTGIYFFIKEKLIKETEITFPIIQESIYIKMRSKIYEILYKSLFQSFLPTIIYTILFWIFSTFITNHISNLFGIENDENLTTIYSILFNFNLIFYVWILSSQILSNMYIMDAFFIILLTKQKKFAIEISQINDSCEITIVEALSLNRVPIAQHLASLDLFNLMNSNNTTRRQEIFTLSIPGGHPYNWNQLSGQCLCMINSFTEELSLALKTISTIRNTTDSTTSLNRIKPMATDAAEKILLRQYNERFGIRNMNSIYSNQSQLMNSYQQQQQEIERKPNPCKKLNDNIENIGNSINNACRTAFYNIPGLFYLFGEPEGGKILHLISNSQDIIWITQAISGICAISLIEDKYGVVQNEIPIIIKSFLKLKLELDKICSINLNGKRFEKNCIPIKNAVKRSLYRICTVFADYMRDLIEDPEELRNIQYFVNYLEI